MECRAHDSPWQQEKRKLALLFFFTDAIELLMTACTAYEQKITTKGNTVLAAKEQEQVW